MTIIYGVISEHSPEGPPPESPAYIARLRVVEIRKDEAHRPAGTCYMQVVFVTDVAIPALNIAAGQMLWFGGDVPLAADVGALLPFSTPAYQGFVDLNTGRIVGDGAVFSSIDDAEARTRRYPQGTPVINLART